MALRQLLGTGLSVGNRKALHSRQTRAKPQEMSGYLSCANRENHYLLGDITLTTY